MPTNENSDKGPTEQQMLLAILKALIPPSRDGSIPGAADIGFPAYIQGESDYSAIQEGLLRLADQAQHEHGKEFSVLDLAEQTRLVERLKVKDFRFFALLSNQITKYYYQHKDVVAALGLPTQPPFPSGHHVEDGDLTLLEPVYERGRKYRE